MNLLLNRRSFVIAGAAILSSTPRLLKAAPGCTLTPEAEEGPYYVDYLKARADVTEGRPGVPLKLRIAIVDAKRCEPLKDAAVDIWHCDAGGVFNRSRNSKGSWRLSCDALISNTEDETRDCSNYNEQSYKLWGS